MVIADLLGVPRDHRAQFRTWSSPLVQGDPNSPEAMQSALTAAVPLYEYFTAFLAERRARPTEDLITALVQAELGGQPPTHEELLGFCLLVLVAGHETSTSLIGSAAVVLAEHPQARDRLAAGTALIPNAIEELLRYGSPFRAWLAA